MSTPPPRVYLDDFALANPLYEGATVSIYLADPVMLTLTNTLAPLYADLTSASTLANPQTLDGNGKWLQAVYVDKPVIMVVGTQSVGTYQTGVAGPYGTFQGQWAPGNQYNLGDVVRDGTNGSDTGSLYFCLSPNTASSSFSNDVTAGIWTLYLDFGPVLTEAVAQVAALAVPIAGGVAMTGLFNLSGDPTGPLNPSTKEYTDAGDSNQAVQLGNEIGDRISQDIQWGSLNSGRNKLLNSHPVIAQRGGGPFTASGYGVDQWYCDAQGGTTSWGRSSVALGGFADDELLYYIAYVCTGSGGSTDRQCLVRVIPGVTRLAAKTLTLSALMASAAGASIAIEFGQYFGTGGSPTSYVSTPLGTLVPQTTLYPITPITFIAPSVQGKVLGTNGDDFSVIRYWFSAGSSFATRASGLGVQSDTFAITQDQLEPNPVASNYEHRDPLVEKSLCQKFFRQVGSCPVNGYRDGTIATTAIGGVYFPDMFATPAVVGTPTWGTLTNVTGSPAISALTPESLRIVATGTAVGPIQAMLTVANLSCELVPT